MSSPDFNEPLTQVPGSSNTDLPSGERAAKGMGKFFQDMTKLFQQESQRQMQDQLEEREREVRKEAKEKGIQEGLESAQEGESPGLKEGETVYQREFNKKLIDSWQSQTRIEMYQKSDDLYEDHKADPKGFIENFEEYKQGIESELPEEMVPRFRSLAERQKRRQMRKIEENYKNIKMDELENVLTAEMRQREKALKDFASNNPYSPQVLRDLKIEFMKTLDDLAEYGPEGEFEVGGQKYKGGNGLLSVSEIKQTFNKLRTKTSRELILSKFTQKSSLDEMKNFRNEFKRDMDRPQEEQKIETGVDLILSDERRRNILEKMDQTITEYEEGKDLELGNIKDRLRGKINFIEDGGMLPTDDVQQVKQDLSVLNKADSDEYKQYRRDLLPAIKANEFFKTWKQKKPADVYNKLQTLKDKKEKGDFDMSTELLQGKIDRLKTIKNKYKNSSPLKAANFSDRYDINKIDLTEYPTGIDTPEVTGGDKPEKLGERDSIEENIIVNFQERSKKLDQIAKDFGSPKSSSVWFDSELSTLKNKITAPGTSSKEKYRIGQMIAKGFGRNAQYALEPLSEDLEVFPHAIGLAVNNDGKWNVAREILKGQELLKTSESPAIPSSSTLKAEMEKSFGNKVFQELPNTKNNILRSAKAYYMNNIQDREQYTGTGDVKFHEDLWEKSIQKVTGANLDPRTGNWEGGIVNFRGQQTILPEKVSKKKFKFAVNNLPMVYSSSNPKSQLGENVLQKLSVGGGKPVLDNPGPGEDTRPFTMEDFKNEQVKFVPAGDGQYNLKINEKFVMGTGENQKYTIDLNFLKDVTLPENITGTRGQGVEREDMTDVEDRPGQESSDIPYVPFF